MRNNIPQELRRLPQWVCANADKKPIDPKTGRAASVTDPSTWGTFEQAIGAGFEYVGFVLTKGDPYTIIDLDAPQTSEQVDRHQKIFESIPSYSEISQSGQGVHIVVRGSVPNGARRDRVEVYSDLRYMIFTGNVIKNLPITDCQPLLDILYREMRPVEIGVSQLVDGESLLSDRDLVEMASNAANGDKFDELCRGDWKAMGYPSQSEADFALLSILAFYTQDNEQVRRLFRYSNLGRRDKATKSNRYLDLALGKIRAKAPPSVDFSALIEQATKFVEQKDQAPVAVPSPYIGALENNGATTEVAEPASQVSPGVSFPPGLVGEIAQYIYQTSIRPVPEISLAAAIALASGVVGRTYNISGTGLNQYLILLARTGTGKEGAATGIDDLVAATKVQVPMVDQFIGPAAFASGQGLVKVLNDRPCFVSVLGEFGITLQQICSPRASSAEQTLKKVLLDLYNKSGWNKVLRSTAYSDVEKNTKTVQAPNVTILGESTPEAFFDGLDPSHIMMGLIPRFLAVEYTGARVPRNRNAGQPPSRELVDRFASLVATALVKSNNNTCVSISADAAGQKLLDDFDVHCDKCINESNNAIDAELWNRAHVKAVKLAGLIAVGVNQHNPVVTREVAHWAIDFVLRDVNMMITRFKSGEVGGGDSAKAELGIRRVIKEFLEASPEDRESYRTPKGCLIGDNIPHSFLRMRLKRNQPFKNDRYILSETLKTLIDSGVLHQLTFQEIQGRCPSVKGKVYVAEQGWVYEK